MEAPGYETIKGTERENSNQYRESKRRNNEESKEMERKLEGTTQKATKAKLEAKNKRKKLSEERIEKLREARRRQIENLFNISAPYRLYAKASEGVKDAASEGVKDAASEGVKDAASVGVEDGTIEQKILEIKDSGLRTERGKKSMEARQSKGRNGKRRKAFNLYKDNRAAYLKNLGMTVEEFAAAKGAPL